MDFAYDPENRLTEALKYQIVGRDGSNRIDRSKTDLEYDGGGRRLVQVYDPKAGNGGIKRVEYVFDGLDPVAEYNMLNGQRTNFYRGDKNLILAMHNFQSGTLGQMYWYHYNHKGDVTGLTKQNGQSHHNYRYDPYGAVVPDSGNFTDPHNHYTLTGKEYDENTGLVWFGARHLDPQTGVWITQDSYRGEIAIPQSLHRSMYVANNPINFIDRDGRFFQALLIVEAVVDLGTFIYDAGRVVKNTVEIAIDEVRYVYGLVTDDPVLTEKAVTSLNKNLNELLWAGLNTAFDAVATAVPYLPASSKKSLKLFNKGDDLYDAQKKAGGIHDASKLADGASDVVKCKKVCSDGAQNAANALRLRKQLASEAGVAELAAGGGITIAGAGTSTPIRDVSRLVSEYGGTPGNWEKVVSEAHKFSDLTTIEVHGYRNVITGTVVELKSKIGMWSP